MENATFKIVPAESSIDWIGKKVTGAHNGTIAVKEGHLLFQHDKFTGGSFIIDTTAIKILDVKDPDTNTQFANHLASDDFFSIEKYPEAVFEITSSVATTHNHYHITGSLTIKGITHTNSFDAEIDILGDTLKASGKLIIDRTKYDMKFRSGNFFQNLGDTLIYNEFELTIHLTAKAALL